MEAIDTIPLKELPIYNILGTDFYIDINSQSLTEINEPTNIILFSDMHDKLTHYEMRYQRGLRNWPEGVEPLEESTAIKIPQMTALDPVRMAKRYALTVQDISGKSDFEVMVDINAYNRRMGGELPTIDFDGHRYQVDLSLQRLRSLYGIFYDDIPFSQIGAYYDRENKRYVIPFDPETCSIPKIDYGKMDRLPDGMHIYSFPHESELDRMAWNIREGHNIHYRLKEYGLKMEFEAQRSPWNDLLQVATVKAQLKRGKTAIKDEKFVKANKRKRKLRGL